ncbi:MAG: hypothetical protein GY866_03560 [Proteobacteria bacterium]|nr:hypothetical protein [Pseudomonadota bacterium]
MNSLATLSFYVCVGLIGGFVGHRLKIPAGALVGAMLMVIVAKLILKSNWETPKSYGFILQVLLGVMVGASFHPSLMATFYKIAIPVVVSSVVLVGTGILMSIVFTKLGFLDIGTGYIGTSPGAMSVLLVLAVDSNVNAAVITCFHLFRVMFVILTAPLILKLIST